MYTLHPTKKFEKDYKLCIKRGLNLELINTALELLEKTGTLPSKYKPHKLRGNYVNYSECHIQPDWLLIWHCDKNKKEIQLIRTGTHSDLF
ncbi:MAG: type II toxin-antitoxin system YafQ family toxin [Bacteroidia bacterium]